MDSFYTETFSFATQYAFEFKGNKANFYLEGDTESVTLKFNREKQTITAAVRDYGSHPNPNSERFSETTRTFQVDDAADLDSAFECYGGVREYAKRRAENMLVDAYFAASGAGFTKQGFLDVATSLVKSNAAEFGRQQMLDKYLSKRGVEA
ncbi:MAG: hypothetical protein CLLPBCKN_003359 [Chroococcidiopsis cubana SAG 39.79]|uniref:Uncharacterized protein n=1 Tax=Chroococcidiopsis cubana SAG 39.79 TaxID=388085 RepID=A0AB37UA88_9CYAN|nr:hypothetical protein [Chroococcidiopsis cubana]MDZ4873963.1 hypothetical protein [Chroococcidiopsis cubana SAG 39.79]PSB59675.1 hypothetical protein C7B79_28595 [Chroococcidiopsis cubana CCALA 043]RUT00477.1 hypothetical protein DSM107010_67850 [Chroococcidiopsis cubana SAG 39.79]